MYRSILIFSTPHHREPIGGLPEASSIDSIAPVVGISLGGIGHEPEVIECRRKIVFSYAPLPVKPNLGPTVIASIVVP